MKDKRIKLFVGAALMYIIGMILMMLFTLSCSKDEGCGCTETTYDVFDGFGPNGELLSEPVFKSSKEVCQDPATGKDFVRRTYTVIECD